MSFEGSIIDKEMLLRGFNPKDRYVEEDASALIDLIDADIDKLRARKKELIWATNSISIL